MGHSKLEEVEEDVWGGGIGGGIGGGTGGVGEVDKRGNEDAGVECREDWRGVWSDIGEP